MTQHNPLVVDPVIHDCLQPLFNALIGVRTSSWMLNDCYSIMLTRKDECGLPSFEEWPNKAASVGIDFHAEPIWTVIMRKWMTVYRDWCDAIALAQTVLNTPEVVGMMNTGESRVSKRWTVKANLDLAALAATMHPMFFGGVDGLGFIRNGLPPLPAAFEKQAIKIAEHSNTVRAIHSAAEILTNNGGDNEIEADGNAPVSQPTMGKLTSLKECIISDDTFRRIRVAAKVRKKLNGVKPRERRYSQSEVGHLIEALLSGKFNNAKTLIEGWSKWATRQISK